MSKRRTIVVVAVVLVALLAGAVIGFRWWPSHSQTTFEQATAYAPADAVRLSWTDWAAVRRQVGASVDADSSEKALESFLDQGYATDLTSASALLQSAPVLQTSFGFSPASIDWELFSQADDGAVVIMRLPDDTDFDALADQLERIGFTRPDDDQGVWQGGDTLLPEIGAELTPELQYVAVDAEAGLVLTSDIEGYLQQVVDGLGDDELPGTDARGGEGVGRPAVGGGLRR